MEAGPQLGLQFAALELYGTKAVSEEGGTRSPGDGQDGDLEVEAPLGDHQAKRHAAIATKAGDNSDVHQAAEFDQGYKTASTCTSGKDQCSRKRTGLGWRAQPGFGPVKPVGRVEHGQRSCHS